MSGQKSAGFTEKLAAKIVDKRGLMFLLYICAAVFCVFSMGWVQVENDVTTYLPEDTETRQGLEAMTESFGMLGTARVMVSNVTYDTAQTLAQRVGSVPGVAMVTFDATADHYKNATALFDVNFAGAPKDPDTIRAMQDIRSVLAGYDVNVDSTVGLDENAMLDQEMAVILVVAVIIIFVALTLTSRSYAEVPVLLITFGAAALLNMGTNFLCGKISFISDSIAVVLQLALAIDYAIILCHRFSDERELYPARQAAIVALSKAIPEISASSLTTVSGLGALAFMKFAIGLDMAVVLIKAILLSLLSVFTLMPGLLVLFSPLMDRTRHKRLLPPITPVGKFAVKVRRVLPPLFVLVLVGACALSARCPYTYSYTNLRTAKMTEQQHAYFNITDAFGTSNMAAVLVPVGDYEAEAALLEELEACPQVKSTLGLAGIEAMDGYKLTDALTPRQLAELVDMDYEVMQLLYSAYAAQAGQLGAVVQGIQEYKVPLFDMILFLKDQMDANGIQLELDGDMDVGALFDQLDTARAQMQSEKYSRMVVYLDLPEESEETFAFLDTMREIIGKYYPGDYYIVGNSTSSRDLASSFTRDNTIISLLSILFVILVLLFTFRSAGLSLLLILVIQGSIWINFSFPTLMEQPLYFLGYLIVQALQMGANIDYAIVISSHYQEEKRHMPHKQAIVHALNAAFPTVFTSGTIMASAGLLIGNLSAQPVVSIMGTCIGRGTIISMVLVLFVLPSFLVLGDSIIERTRFKVKGILPQTQTAQGTLRVRGHVRGYVSGMVDGEFDGTLQGRLEATVTADTAAEEGGVTDA